AIIVKVRIAMNVYGYSVGIEGDVISDIYGAGCGEIQVHCTGGGLAGIDIEGGAGVEVDRGGASDIVRVGGIEIENVASIYGDGGVCAGVEGLGGGIVYGIACLDVDITTGTGSVGIASVEVEGASKT